MDYPFIKVEHREAVGWLTFNRPDKLNAISVEFAAELTDFFSGLCNDLQTRVVIVRNEGRAFCAGADMNDIAKVNSEAYVDNELGEMQNAYGFGKSHSDYPGIQRGFKRGPPGGP